MGQPRPSSIPGLGLFPAFGFGLYFYGFWAYGMEVLKISDLGNFINKGFFKECLTQINFRRDKNTNIQFKVVQIIKTVNFH